MINLWLANFLNLQNFSRLKLPVISTVYFYTTSFHLTEEEISYPETADAKLQKKKKKKGFYFTQEK